MKAKLKGPKEAPKESDEYNAFAEGLRKVLKTPKAEIEKREAEWRKAKSKPKA